MSDHPARVEPWVRWLCGDLPPDHPDAVKMIEAVKNCKRFKLPSHLKPARILGVRTPGGCSDYEDDDDDYDDDDEEEDEEEKDDDDGKDSSKIEQQNQASSSEQSANNIPAPVQRDRSPSELAELELYKLFKVPRVGGQGFIIKDLEFDYEAERYADDNGFDHYDDDEVDSEEEQDAVNRLWRENFTREEAELDLKCEDEFRELPYPEFASRDQVVKATTEYEQHELRFKFLGGGYIEVEITRDTIVAALLEVGERLLQSKIQAAPEVFTFIGEQRTRYKAVNSEWE
ncbi:hypothetical protein V8F06_013554 [Rhypophila decipiens]